jgi:hypothetical protein
MRDALLAILDNPWLAAGWALLTLASLAAVIRDLRLRNRGLAPLMKWVWGLTVLYSGPIGLAVYAWSGRRQIPRDSLGRRAARSVCHCYAGCGGGEVAGVLIAAGILSLGTWWVAAISFALAYAAGYALTAGPLIQEGVPVGTALRDAFTSETASITVMEVVAIGADLWLAGGAGMGELRFWTALALSLSLGLAAAYPVNILLIRWGVKEGMHDPRMQTA